MDLIKGIETRKSFRAFKSTPIPRETLEKILKIASNSPSYMNTQPWEVAVVTGKKKEELSKILFDMAKANVIPVPDLPHPQTWPPLFDERHRIHSIKRFKTIGVDRDNAQQREELRLLNFKFYGAPCVLYLFMNRELGSWSIFDMGLFSQTIALTAHSFGLGTCLQAYLTNYPKEVFKCLGISESKTLVLGISIGYPDLEARINSYDTERVGLDAFARWYE